MGDNIKCLLKNGKGRLWTILKWPIKAGYFVRDKQALHSIKDEILLLDMPNDVISALSLSLYKFIILQCL